MPKKAKHKKATNLEKEEATRNDGMDETSKRKCVCKQQIAHSQSVYIFNVQQLKRLLKNAGITNNIFPFSNFVFVLIVGGDCTKTSEAYVQIKRITCKLL